MRINNKANKKQALPNQAGFTLVELMISSMVFAVMLLLVAATIVRFTHTFQRGVIETSTQNTARSIMDTVSQALQFGRDYDDPNATTYCVGSTKYEYRLGQQVDGALPGQYGLLQKLGTGIGCSGTGSTSQELIPAHMRLSKLDIIEDPSTMTFTVTVKIAYGDADLFIGDTADARKANAESANPVCDPKIQFQFCAVRELSTTVQRRL